MFCALSEARSACAAPGTHSSCQAPTSWPPRDVCVTCSTPAAFTQSEEVGGGVGPHGLHVGGVCLCADSPSMLPCLSGDLTKAYVCPACRGHEAIKAWRCGLSIFRAVDRLSHSRGPSGERCVATAVRVDLCADRGFRTRARWPPLSRVSTGCADSPTWTRALPETLGLNV